MRIYPQTSLSYLCFLPFLSLNERISMFSSHYLKIIQVRCLVFPWAGCEHILTMRCKIWVFVYLPKKRVPQILSCPQRFKT